MSRWMTLVLPLTILFVDVASAQQRPPSPSPQTPADVLRGAQQGAAEIQQLRAALRGPDASARVAAFTAMIESNNPSLAAIAINEGRASADVVLRDLATRAAFREVKTFTPEPVAELPEKSREDYGRYTGDRSGLFLTISEYDWKAGAFKTTGGGHGQISAGRLSFGSAYCQANLMALEGTWTFEGVVNCTGMVPGLLRTKMRLDIR